MASFNMYHDRQEHFLFVENSGQWFMSLYTREAPFAKIPKIPDVSNLIPIKDVGQYEFNDYPEVTKCKECSNDGFIWDSWDDTFQTCECYHGQTHGELSLENYIEGCKEAYALKDVL